MEGQGMTSERTISQVRAILNKLDRSIDEARERRRQGPATTLNHAPAQASYPPPPQTLAPTLPAPAAAPAAQAAPSTSGFGRAQPLRPQASHSLRFNQH
jgi:hypothetical protein